MTKARWWTGVLGAAVLALSPATAALAQRRQPAVANPDAEVQRALTTDAARIDALLAKALDRTAPTAQRTQAISDMGGLYFDHLLANAEPLVQDPDAEVARLCVLELGGQIAMLHGSHGGPADASGHDYAGHLVGESLRLLRLALDHPSPDVRNEAVAVLASRGDLQSLAWVKGRIDGGQLSVPEGVRYLSLAPLDVAAPYIAAYLSSPDAESRRAAIAPLSYLPGYTTAVRRLALEANAPDAVVQAALPGLAQTDQEFASYGPALAQNKTRSRETREVALESSVAFALRTNASDVTVRALADALASAADEMQSEKARDAIRDLKAKRQIE